MVETKAKEMETMMPVENLQELKEFMAFLSELEPEEKKDFLVFMQGIKFIKGMPQKDTQQTA